MILKYDIGKKPKETASVLMVLMVLYAIRLLFASPRIHNKEQMRGKQIDVLPENECHFRPAITLDEIDQKVEGIRVDSVRYKMSNGCDFYFEDNELKPAGFGTKIIVAIKSGRIKEPEVIQSIDCWK